MFGLKTTIGALAIMACLAVQAQALILDDYSAALGLATSESGGMYIDDTQTVTNFGTVQGVSIDREITISQTAPLPPSGAVNAEATNLFNTLSFANDPFVQSVLTTVYSVSNVLDSLDLTSTDAYRLALISSDLGINFTLRVRDGNGNSARIDEPGISTGVPVDLIFSFGDFVEEQMAATDLSDIKEIELVLSTTVAASDSTIDVFELIPEPASASLLGLAGLALLGRRRRMS